MNAVCWCLAEYNALPHENSVHVLTEFTWSSMPDFFGPFHLIINTYHVNHVYYDGATVDGKRTLVRAKNITRMANNSFHSLNVSNTWSITSIHNKLLVTCYNCDADDYILSKCPLPCN